MKVGTKIELKAIIGKRDNEVGQSILIEGSFPDLVQILMMAMRGHHLMHAIIEAADAAYHDEKLQAKIDEATIDSRMETIRDEVKIVREN